MSEILDFSLHSVVELITPGMSSDWTIVSEEGQRFPCHRDTLAAKSSTMKAMMTTEIKEKEVKKTKIHYNNRVEDAMFSLANIYHAGTVKEATEIFIVENKKIPSKQDFSQVPQDVMGELSKPVTWSWVAQWFLRCGKHYVRLVGRKGKRGRGLAHLSVSLRMLRS